MLWSWSPPNSVLLQETSSKVLPAPCHSSTRRHKGNRDKKFTQVNRKEKGHPGCRSPHPRAPITFPNVFLASVISFCHLACYSLNICLEIHS